MDSGHNLNLELIGDVDEGDIGKKERNLGLSKWAAGSVVLIENKKIG